MQIFSNHAKNILDYTGHMTNSNLWNERLAAEIRANNVSMAELARRTGIPYDSINKYVRGDVKNPRGDTIATIAAALNVNQQWLVFGAGPKEIGTTQLDKNNEIHYDTIEAAATFVLTKARKFTSDLNLDDEEIAVLANSVARISLGQTTSSELEIKAAMQATQDIKKRKTK